MSPLEGARAALVIVELLWRVRRACAAHGVRIEPGEAARLRAAGAGLRTAVAAMEAGELGAVERVTAAIDAVWVEVRRGDTVQGLLGEARRAARGEKLERKSYRS